MFVFEVKDMSCGGCVASITRAVQAVDKAADVQIDLAHRRVEVRGSALDAAALATTIAAAGYKPVLANPAPAIASAAPAKVSGCCCG